MKRKIILAVLLCWLVIQGFTQVGIGTVTPNPNAALDVQSTSRGILFPRMTTAQRNAITNPPNGLHIFNTDDACLNYFDSLSNAWSCYCANCETIIINITSNACSLNFYETYAKEHHAKKYIINVAQGVSIFGGQPGEDGLSFTSMMFDAVVIINNHGIITGAGGKGGNGAIELSCASISENATAGNSGGSAVATKSGVPVTINNYGYLSGGGGGGGGSGGTTTNNSHGGGGGGGAGIAGGSGGLGGGSYAFGSSNQGCIVSRSGTPGSPGQPTTGGAGGISTSGGAQGGNGGDRAQPGQPGSGNLSSGATGGAAGKVIAGGIGNTVNNLGAAESFGAVD